MLTLLHAKFQISSYTVVSVSEQAGLNLTRSETPKTGFLTTRHIQHAHSYFCLGVHVPPGVSIWRYMIIFEGTHILELFFHS